jgi:hypothetical protein
VLSRDTPRLISTLRNTKDKKMVQDNRGAPPSRDGRPGGNRRDGPGGPRKGGGFGKGPTKAPRAETYESLKELMRGPDFRIDKFQIAEKGTGRPVKTEYRLTREGLAETHNFERLSDAQAAATAELPAPEAEAPVEEMAVEPIETAGEETHEAPVEAEPPAA